jgi:hypothetical protein
LFKLRNRRGYFASEVEEGGTKCFQMTNCQAFSREFMRVIHCTSTTVKKALQLHFVDKNINP